MKTLTEVFVHFLTTIITAKQPFNGKCPVPDPSDELELTKLVVAKEDEGTESGGVSCPLPTINQQDLLENILWDVSFSLDGHPIIQMSYTLSSGVTISFYTNYFRNISSNTPLLFKCKTAEEQDFIVWLKPYLAKSFKNVIDELFKDTPVPDCVCPINLIRQPNIIIDVDEIIARNLIGSQ